MREYGLKVLKEQWARFCQDERNQTNSIFRMQQMNELKQNRHGQYSEIKDEKEVVRVTALV
jgi:hypothetical protein